MDTTHSILRSARSFFAGTALSRISGLGRDIAMAIAFGSSAEIAAFMVAYRLANLFRRLLGEGNLQAGFVPHFTAMKEEGGAFYRDTLCSMSLILAVVVVFLEAILWGLSHWAGPDWIEIVELTMWMTPGLFFISLYALNASLLQCRKKYFLPAVAPVAFNFIWMGAAFLVPDVRGLAIAVTVAFAGQWLMTSFEGGALLRGKPKLFSPEFKALLKPLALGIVGIGAVQFNSALDTIFARLADLKGPAFLWYAIRIQQLPLALFGIALSGALLPPLSRATDPARRLHLLRSALRTSGALMLVCTFGIFATGGAGLNLLYGHGDFASSDVKQTLDCLWGYGIGLVPSVFVLLLAAYFYAQKNYRIPTLASLASVIANISLNAFFVFALGWGAVSVAIATSLSAVLNMALLSRGVFTADFWKFFGKIGGAAALAATVTWVAESYLFPMYPRILGMQVVHVLSLAAIYLTGLVLILILAGVGAADFAVADRVEEVDRKAER